MKHSPKPVDLAPLPYTWDIQRRVTHAWLTCLCKSCREFRRRWQEEQRAQYNGGQHVSRHVWTLASYPAVDELLAALQGDVL